jgi:tRNA pseudouridine38-40 synthase
MPRYALTIEYDGRAFAGTQAQRAGLRTLQGVLAEAASRLDGAPVDVRLASRLDAEVSALALTGDLVLGRTWDPAALGMALTSHLPPDVAVRRVAAVADRWSARNDAAAKTYAYRIRHRPVRPVLDQRCLWLRQIDHPERLHQLAAQLIGDHDLSGFACLRGDDTDADDPRRRVLAAEWTREDDAGDGLWHFRITGEGFLYKQVRGLVGAMVFVAQGRAGIADFAAAMRHGRGARRLGNIAPGNALLLERTRYEPEPDWVETRGNGQPERSGSREGVPGSAGLPDSGAPGLPDSD